MKTIIIALLFSIMLCANGSKELRVGIYDNEPKIFLDEMGNPSGFFVDILNEIAKNENWTLSYKKCAWQECLAMLEKGDLDIMPDVAYSKEREKHFLFNKEVVLSNWSTLFANKNSDIISLLDLEGKKIALLEGSIQQEQLEAELKLYNLHPLLLPVKDFHEAFELTRSGLVDAAILNRHFGAKHFEKYNLVQTSILFNPAVLKFALTNTPQNQAIAQRLDYHLDVMQKKRDSLYYTSKKKWLDVEKTGALPEWFYPFLIITSVVLSLLIAAILFFKYLLHMKTKEIIANAQLLQATETEKAHNYKQVLYSLSAMIEQRDSYTAGHSARVGHYCELIAAAMGYNHEEQTLLYKAAMLHDIGKVAIPDAILLKPEKLTQTEYSIIQEHVNVGIKILQDVPIFEDLLEIIKYHHEKYDGSGYPAGLTKDAIPKLARIMMVADAFDAMTTNRIYKHKKSSSEAIEEILALSGIHYHPEVTQAAAKALKEVDTSKKTSQTPKTLLEEQRFVYFYKDGVTGLYNAKYLEVMLLENGLSQTFQKMAIVSLHHFDIYNKEHSWEDGDKVLKEFASLLQELFGDKTLFRVRANDFIILLHNGDFLEKEKAEIEHFLTTKKLSYDCLFYDLFENKIDSYEKLKKFL